MKEKWYMVQARLFGEGDWHTIDTQYSTLKEAEQKLARWKDFANLHEYRIEDAEAYAKARNKDVKCGAGMEVRKHYVIQWRTHEGGPWVTYAAKYATIEKAREHAELAGYQLGKYYRIAEAYVQVRYKAVKE